MRPILPLALAALVPTTALAEPTARYVVALSDVDMAGTAYEDGLLRAPLDAVDTLSVFGTTDPSTALAAIPATNAVNSPPAVLDLSPDGTRAAVVETLRPRPEGATTCLNWRRTSARRCAFTTCPIRPHPRRWARWRCPPCPRPCSSTARATCWR